MNRILTLQTELNAFRPGSREEAKKKSRYSLEKSGPYSFQKNPAGLFGIAGLTAVEAADLGLSATGLLAPAAAKSGSLTITSDKAQRLLTAQARQKMKNPGKTTYTYPILWINFDRPIGNFADAMIEVTWEGNPYGEIGAAYVRRNLANTTAFTKSSLNVGFSKLDRIPMQKDPREWPVVFGYDGTYDPWGNGQYEFQGEFEINAFGGLKFNRHEVKSVSLADFAIRAKPEELVQRKSNRSYTVPDLPADQRTFLMEQLGNP